MLKTLKKIACYIMLIYGIREVSNDEFFSSKKCFFKCNSITMKKLPFLTSYFAPSQKCTHIGMLYTVDLLDLPVRSMKNSIFFKNTHGKAEH